MCVKLPSKDLNLDPYPPHTLQTLMLMEYRVDRAILEG